MPESDTEDAASRSIRPQRWKIALAAILVLAGATGYIWSYATRVPPLVLLCPAVILFAGGLWLLRSLKQPEAVLAGFATVAALSLAAAAIPYFASSTDSDRHTRSTSPPQTALLKIVQLGAPLRHPGEVESVAFSPDGRTLIAAGGHEGRGAVLVWDVQARKQHSLIGHTDRVNAVAFSPDGRTLATGSRDRAVMLWDVQNEFSGRELTRHSDFVESVAFSPDGKLLATSSDDETVQLWRSPDQFAGNSSTNLTGKLSGHSTYALSTVFSPNNEILATGDEGTVRLWKVATGEQIQSFAHDGKVDSLAFSPDGTLLAAAGGKSAVRMWNIADPERPRHIWDVGRADTVAFSPDGMLLATGGGDDRQGTLALWDWERRKAVYTNTDHKGPVDSLAFSPDGKTLATGSADETTRLWRIP